MHQMSKGKALHFLAGGGEMGERIRSHDWTKTPLDLPGQWPLALKMLVGIMLGSNQPMFITWGRERIMLYNNGYAPLLGTRHPVALGKPFEEVWFDILDDVGPILDRAYAGQSTQSDDIRLIMHRHGYAEETHFSFFYAPVRDEAGDVVGMFCACNEITDRVLAERRRAFLFELSDALRSLGDPQEIKEAASRVLGEHIGANRAAHFDVTATDYVVECDYANGVQHIPGRHPISSFGSNLLAAFRTGRPLWSADVYADAELSPTERAAFDSIQARAYIGVPLIKDGKFVAGLAVHSAEPREWTAEEVALVEETAERTWSAVERARAEAKLRDQDRRTQEWFRQAPGLICILRGPDHIFEFANHTYCRFVGNREFVGRPVREVLPEVEGQGFFELLDEAYRTGKAATGSEVPIRLQRAPASPPDDLFVDFVFEPIKNEAGEVEGTFVEGFDATARVRSQRLLSQRESEFRGLANHMDQLAWMADGSGWIYWYNKRWYDFTGTTLEQMQGWGWQKVHHPEHVERMVSRATRYWQVGEPWEETFPLRAKDGSYRWFLTRAMPIRSADGEIERWFGTNTDVTERMQAEERQQLLINELNHRVKNTLATVQAIATQTFRGERESESKESFISRLRALAAAHDVLTEESWERADLRQIVESTLRPFLADAPDRMSIEGPHLFVAPKVALALAMALHELATNAAKYGALTSEAGKVAIAWWFEPAGEEERFRFVWRESGGPPVSPPTKSGFGSRMIQRTLASEFRGEAWIDYAAEGVVCEIDALSGRLRRTQAT